MRERTPEQVAADDALTKAIVAVDRAYNGSASDGDVLDDYVVVAAWRRLEDDGYIYVPTNMLVRDNDVPTYRARGLLTDTLEAMRARGLVTALLAASDE